MNAETQAGERRFRLNGAAPESNRPSRGLHDRTGFEDRVTRSRGSGSARMQSAALHRLASVAGRTQEALYSEIQKIYSDAAPIASIAYLGATAGWRSNVDGFFIDGLSYYRFEDVKFSK